LLTRSIDDPFELTIEEKIFHGAKRLCTVFAIAAVTLTTLDMMNIRSVEAAADFVHANRQRFADLPDMIRSGIQSIALASPLEPSATAMIPRGDIAIDIAMPSLFARETTTRIKTDASPIAELAAARHLDAIEVAMEQPFDMTKSALPVVAAPPAAPSMILASADPAPLPLPEITPMPVSLPMSAAIPLDMVPLPQPAPGAPPPSPAELLHLEGKDYAKAERCLVNAIYFEARSEPVSGQIAVAQVVMNRVFSGFYPNDVCGVVYQNAHRHLACQFTFACDGKSKIINERGAWARANRIAKQTLDGKLYVATVGTSTHYHAVYVRPNWVREMHKTARYGIHNFYRPIAWGNGSDEPVWGTAAVAQNKKK
jgi:Cell Wall Hydrolase